VRAEMLRVLTGLEHHAHESEGATPQCTHWTPQFFKWWPRMRCHKPPWPTTAITCSGRHHTYPTSHATSPISFIVTPARLNIHHEKGVEDEKRRREQVITIPCPVRRGRAAHAARQSFRPARHYRRHRHLATSEQGHGPRRLGYRPRCDIDELELANKDKPGTSVNSAIQFATSTFPIIGTKIALRRQSPNPERLP